MALVVWEYCMDKNVIPLLCTDVIIHPCQTSAKVTAWISKSNDVDKIQCVNPLVA